jgi:hypothetical protein
MIALAPRDLPLFKIRPIRSTPRRAPTWGSYCNLLRPATVVPRLGLAMIFDARAVIPFLDFPGNRLLLFELPRQSGPRATLPGSYSPRDLTPGFWAYRSGGRQDHLKR